jgi:hypothetical protein
MIGAAVRPASQPTVEQLLDERALALVGRARELGALEGLLGGGRAVVAYVHGIPGSGKSALLRGFAAAARGGGATVVQLDGALVEPTERGLAAALAAVAPGGLGTGSERVVLVLDHAERLRLLDDHLRRELIPALPQHVRVVLAARERPGPEWAGTYGDLLLQLPLGTLTGADAEALLAGLGVAAPDARAVNRIARGHPLSLRLAAAALAARPDLPLEEVAAATVVEEIAGLYLAGLDARTRRALDAAALVRRPTRSVLRDMLPGDDAGEAFAALAALPFAELGADGLVLHDTVRDAVDATLRATDPARRRRLRAAAYRHLRAELRTAPPAELWRSTADMLFLIDNPLIRDGFFPASDRGFAIEPAAERDGPAVAAIAERHEPPAAAALLRAWFDAAPEAFRVARDRGGGVAGVMAVCEPGAVPARLRARDPLAAPWREDLRRRPVRRDERVLVTRTLLDRDAGESRSPAQAALWVDAKRAYMALRPHLRRMYVQTRRPDVFAPLLEPLGFAPVEDGVVVLGGVAYVSLVLDFGPRSVDGWLGTLVAGELEIEDEPLIDTARRELVAGGRRIPLTELELALIGRLSADEGRPVSRADLLRDVWGHEWQGGGNVIEVAVSGLRRKLGDDDPAIETVRGVGYRLRAR